MLEAVQPRTMEHLPATGAARATDWSVIKSHRNIQESPASQWRAKRLPSFRTPLATLCEIELSYLSLTSCAMKELPSKLRSRLLLTQTRLPFPYHL